jgi:hypothetical protein
VDAVKGAQSASGGLRHWIRSGGTMSDYQQEWKTYRRLRRRFLFLWLGAIPMFLTVVALSEEFFGKGVIFSAAASAVAFGWIALFFQYGFRLRRWNCPRCHLRFESSFLGVLTPRCANCGLPIYSN